MIQLDTRPYCPAAWADDNGTECEYWGHFCMRAPDHDGRHVCVCRCWIGGEDE